MRIFYQEKAFHARKKIRKIDFASSDWYSSIMFLPFSALFRKFHYSDQGVGGGFITDEGAQFTWIWCILSKLPYEKHPFWANWIGLACIWTKRYSESQNFGGSASGTSTFFVDPHHPRFKLFWLPSEVEPIFPKSVLDRAKTDTPKCGPHQCIMFMNTRSLLR